MAFVENFLTPIIKGIVYLGIFVWLVYIFYWIMMRSTKNMGLFLKYKVFRRKYDEKVVEWCVKADSMNYTVEKVRKELLLAGHQPKNAEEIAYIYTQIRKLKGGLAQDEQRIRESHLKTLPKI